jgi:hypothetical protein
LPTEIEASLTSARGGGGRRPLRADWVGDWVDHRACLDEAAKIKMSALVRKQIVVVHPITSYYTDRRAPTQLSVLYPEN